MCRSSSFKPDYQATIIAMDKTNILHSCKWHMVQSCLPAGGLQVESDIAPSRSAMRTQLHAATAAQLEINHHQPFTTHTVHSLSIVHSLPIVHLLPTVHCPFTTHCLSLPLSAPIHSFISGIQLPLVATRIHPAFATTSQYFSLLAQRHHKQGIQHTCRTE